MAVSDFLSKLKQRVSSQIPVNKTGMWYQDDEVIVPSNRITMKGPEGEDDYFEKPILGTGVDSGKQVMMEPGEEYEFPDDSAVHEQYMQLGGIKTGITNINPQGDIAYGANKKIGNFSAGMQGSVNAPGLTAGSVNPSLSYQKGNFSARATPTSFGAAVEGRKAYASYDQNKEGQTMYRNASAGYNTDKVNLNADVNFRDNSFEGGQVSGSYNFTPNLSVTGNYGVNKSDAGLEKNYFAGFRYNKSFQTGGWANWKPNTGKPLLRTSPAGNAGYSDNTRVAPAVNTSKPIVKPPTAPVKKKDDFTEVALQKMRELEKLYSAEHYEEKLDKLRAKEEANPNVDYSLVVDKPYMDLNDPEQVKTLYDSPSVVSKTLDILPTNLSFFARGVLGMDNYGGNLSDQHLRELGYAINTGMKRKQTPAYGFDGSFGYDDYRNGRSDYNDAANNNKVLTTTEVADLQTSIGQAKYKVLPNGDVVVADNYNFDEYAKSPKNIYQAGEVLGAKMGINTQTYVVVPKDYVKDAPVENAPTKVEKSSLREKYAETKTTVPKQLPTPAVKSSTPAKSAPAKTKSTTGTNAVANYQKMLNEKYGAGLEADGAWGPKTQAAYEKYITKKQMQMGANTGFGMTLEAATYVPGPVGMYASGASALSNIAQGDYVGAGLDALNIATAGTAKGLMGVARAANAIRPYSNLALNAAQAGRSVNRVAKKVAPVTRTAGTINELTASNSTMRVPQRDNAQVQFRPNPNMRRMEEGGEVEDDDDKEMVEGVASILRRVKDKNNRQDLAKQLSKQFNREKVKYNLTDFLNKSKVKK